MLTEPPPWPAPSWLAGSGQRGERVPERGESRLPLVRGGEIPCLPRVAIEVVELLAAVPVPDVVIAVRDKRLHVPLARRKPWVLVDVLADLGKKRRGGTARPGARGPVGRERDARAARCARQRHEVDNGGGEVTERHRRRHAHPGWDSRRVNDHERYLEQGSIEAVAVVEETVLAEELAVVGRDDEQRAVEHTTPPEFVDELPDLLV